MDERYYVISNVNGEDTKVEEMTESELLTRLQLNDSGETWYGDIENFTKEIQKGKSVYLGYGILIIRGKQVLPVLRPALREV